MLSPSEWSLRVLQPDRSSGGRKLLIEGAESNSRYGSPMWGHSQWAAAAAVLQGVPSGGQGICFAISNLRLLALCPGARQKMV